MIEDASLARIVIKPKPGLEASNGILFSRKLLYKKIFCSNESRRKNINLDSANSSFSSYFLSLFYINYMILCKGDQVPSLSDSLVTQYSHLHHDPVDNKSVLTDLKS